MAGPLGASPGIVLGVGIGTAAAAAIEPAVELPRQKAWSENKVRVLDPAVMARLVASGGVDLATANLDAGLEGFDTDKVAALVYLAQTVPGFAEAITALRRKTISADDFAHTLVKTAMDARYYPAIEDLQNVWLTPQQVALGIVRGLLTDPGLMPVDLDTSGGNVPAYTVAQIDALTEALGGGIDKERLRVMVGSIGLPMSTQQAANAMFRDIITRGDFNRSILEGDVRPEWADAILEQARQYPSAHDYIEDHLRGWSDEAAMNAGTAKHGMSVEDTAILFRINGRPLSWHQVFIGMRRGGVYNGPTADIDPPFLKALQESNIRPEWYNIAWAQRFTYPAAFVLRALTQGGDVTQAESEQILLYEGWEPALAHTVSLKWAGGTGAAAKVKKETEAQLMQQYLLGVLPLDGLNTALTALGYTAQQADALRVAAELKATSAVRTKNTKLVEKQYVAVKIDEANARQQLAGLAWPANVIDNYIAAWNIERAIQVTTLTVAQVAAALKAGALLASQARPLLADLGEDPAAIETIIATAGANPAT